MTCRDAAMDSLVSESWDRYKPHPLEQIGPWYDATQGTLCQVSFSAVLSLVSQPQDYRR
jgi:hypothetical protein